MRQYAAEQLAAAGETVLIQQRHYDYFLAWTEAHEGDLRGAEQLHWLRRFEGEYANLRAALTWALRDPQGGEAGLRLAGVLGVYWVLHDLLSEGRRWLEAALARSGAEAATIQRGQALFFACVMAWYQGDVPAARQWIEESHALMLSAEYEGQWGIAYTLMMFGQVVRLQGEEEAALRYLRESATRFRQSGDRWGLAVTLDCLASVSLQVGELAAARAALEESQALWRNLGDPWGMGLNSLIFVELAEAAGDEAMAQVISETNRTAFERMGHSWYLSGMQLILGNMALQRADYATAVAQYHQCLAHARRIGRVVREASALIGLGAVTLLYGDRTEGVAHCQAGLLLLERPPRPDVAALCLETVASVADRTAGPQVAARLRAARRRSGR